MKWIRTAFIIHLAIGFGALVFGLAASEAYTLAVVCALMGTYWFITQMARRYGFETILLMVALMIVAVGFYGFPGAYDFPLYLALLVAVPLLGAWDLSFFLRRLLAAEKIANERSLARIHLGRLFMVEGAGLILGMAATVIRLDIPFVLLLVAIFLATIGVSQVVHYMRGQME